MKKIFAIAAALLISAASVATFAQAKKPALMVIPSTKWMTQNQYVTNVEVQGQTKEVPDYLRAIHNDPDLQGVINQIGKMFNERGFQLVDLEARLNKIAQKQAEDAVNSSKTSGASINKNPMDQLLETARPDIRLALDYRVNKIGPKRSITFDLTGFDAYSDKNVASASGTGLPSFTVETAVLLEEAVLAHIDNFTDQLQNHFDDILENGREITMDVKVWDSAPIDLEEEFDGTELGEIIDDWVNENTVNHRYSNDGASENMIEFSGIRMPIYNEKGKAMDAKQFGNKLQKFLAAAPYNLECKVQPRGQGRVIVVIGEK